MPITFHPRPGTVLICDFSTGFRPPEMVKRRQVVVVSPRRRHHSGLCLVVPFSTVAPDPVEAFHHVITAGAYPFFQPHKDVWAKGDMLTCVAFHRLDRVLLNGQYVAPSLRLDDFAAISARHSRCPGDLHALTQEYDESVPVLPDGIGLAEFTPRKASVFRGVCILSGAFPFNSPHPARTPPA